MESPGDRLQFAWILATSTVVLAGLTTVLVFFRETVSGWDGWMSGNAVPVVAASAIGIFGCLIWSASIDRSGWIAKAICGLATLALLAATAKPLIDSRFIGDPQRTVPLDDPKTMGIGGWIQSTEDSSHWLWREWPGIVVVVGYWLLTPLILAATAMNGVARRLGGVCFALLVVPFQMVFATPLRLALRETLGVKYFVFIPEHFLSL